MRNNHSPDSSSRSKAGKSKRNRNISHAEIARAAGVSPGLVSAYFSGNHYGRDRKSGIGIGEATRKKIKETCLKLNYVPDNPLGIYLLYPDKADVGFLLNEVVIEGFANPYHSLVFEGFAKSAFAAEVDLSNLFFRSNHDYLINEDGLPNPILRGAIRKVGITGLPPNYSLIYRLLKMDLALVVVGFAPPIDEVVSVVPDFKESARLAIHTLHQHGHRKIGVAGQFYNTGQDRYNGRLLREGCLQAFQELGLPFEENDFMVFGAKEELSEIAGHFRSKPNRPTGIFCMDDQMARVMAQGLQEAGLSVPEDISIIGCNDDRINQELSPNFSSIHLPCREMGQRAFKELNRVAVEGRPKGQEVIVLPVKFVDRGTVRTL